MMIEELFAKFVLSYFVYVAVYSVCGPNGEQTTIVTFVTLFRTCGTASEIIAAGAANINANTQIIDAVKTVKGRV